MRLAARGVVDFRQCDIHDKAWKTRLGLLKFAMRQEERLELKKLSFQYHAACTSNVGLKVSETSADAVAALEDIRGMFYPWLGITSEERQARQEEHFKEEWEKLTGFSPDDQLSMEQWEEQLRNHLENSTMAQEQEQEERSRQLMEFNERVEAIRKQRLRGRSK